MILAVEGGAGANQLHKSVQQGIEGSEPGWSGT